MDGAPLGATDGAFGWGLGATRDMLQHRWCCHVGWVWLPTACGVPGRVVAPHGAQSASLPWVPPMLVARAAALQPAWTRKSLRAPHPNGLSVGFDLI